MKYSRSKAPGSFYFFTLVTFNRKPIFKVQQNCELFMQSLDYVKRNHPFELFAYCICLDHLHMIWKLPENDFDFSTRIRLAKSFFSRNLKDKVTQSKNPSRTHKAELDVWQRRFWEHLIRDEKDLANHLEYIHFNPVKHRLTNSPWNWVYSSFSRFVEEGLYDEGWGEDSDMNYLDKVGNE
jgi:putative transposase